MDWRWVVRVRYGFSYILLAQGTDLEWAQVFMFYESH
jgi:hypothetical protein